jgi:cell division protein FtsB
MPLRGRRPRASFLTRLARPLLSLGLLTSGLILAGAFVGIAVQGNSLDRDTALLRLQIAQAERELAEKQAEVERRKTEDYVVETARDYGYVRPGEGLIAVESAPREGAVIGVPGLSVDRVARWLALFFGPR